MSSIVGRISSQQGQPRCQLRPHMSDTFEYQSRTCLLYTSFHLQSLFVVAFWLLVITFVVNVAGRLVVRRTRAGLA